MINTRLIAALFWLLWTVSGISQSLEEKLSDLSSEYGFSYAALKTDTLFTEKYILWFDQPVDHKSSDGETFRQRVFLSHKDAGEPVIFITEGYDAYYAASPRYVSEMAGILGANQIVVEHRYFGKSKPDPLNWDHLTVYNAAADQHRVITVLKHLYQGKWISTGISKGGQTAMYHRFFYPDDVDMTVPYVAPLNFSTEERRVYRFLKQVGSKECRDKILRFQTKLLENKADYLPAFQKLAAQKKLNYRMGIEKAFELTVFEYSFAFWQWGQYGCDKIPDDFSDKEKTIRHLDDVAGIDWISDEGIQKLQPFFYQAMREIGFYGYDITPFRSWTSFETNPTFEFTLPEDVEVTYEPQLMQEVDHFIRHKAERMLFIYGEYDPWSATGVDLTYHTSSMKVVKPGGSHRTRIRNLPPELKDQVLNTLEDWLSQP
jgi:hypothetical protein